MNMNQLYVQRRSSSMTFILIESTWKIYVVIVASGLTCNIATRGSLCPSPPLGHPQLAASAACYIVLYGCVTCFLLLPSGHCWWKLTNIMVNVNTMLQNNVMVFQSMQNSLYILHSCNFISFQCYLFYQSFFTTSKRTRN